MAQSRSRFWSSADIFWQDYDDSIKYWPATPYSAPFVGRRTNSVLVDSPESVDRFANAIRAEGGIEVSWDDGYCEDYTRRVVDVEGYLWQIEFVQVDKQAENTSYSTMDALQEPTPAMPGNRDALATIEEDEVLSKA